MKTRRFYENVWYALATIYMCLIFFFFQKDTKIAEDAFWSNPWYGLITIIFASLLIFCLCRTCYLAGRDREREIWKRE